MGKPGVARDSRVNVHGKSRNLVASHRFQAVCPPHVWKTPFHAWKTPFHAWKTIIRLWNRTIHAWKSRFLRSEANRYPKGGSPSGVVSSVGFFNPFTRSFNFC